MKDQGFLKGLLLGAAVMSLFIAIRAYATPQQIIPSREVVAMEDMARQLRVMNERGLRVRIEEPLEVKVKDEVTMKLPTFTKLEVKITDPIDVRVKN
ncbi:MAG: hypothetical protein JNJ45_12535 [Chthonomonas sp.]|nr:hypothetical protein [Chthonomonas sp.]